MKYLIELTEQERAAMVDALTKGASRHAAFAKFKPASPSASKHEQAAILMNRLRQRFERLES